MGAALGTGDSPALAATRLAEAALARGDIARAEMAIGSLREDAAAVRRSVAEASAARLTRLLRQRDGFP